MRIKPAYDEDLHDQGSSRRPRGWLNADVKRITDYFVTGQLVLLDEQVLTPHRISQAFRDIEMLETLPSAGAITEVLRRWERWGFAEIATEPLRFIDYTEKGRQLGLAECEKQYKDAKKTQTPTSAA